MKDKSDLIKKAEALRTARTIGCSGAHKNSNGTWMPCSTHEEMERISNMAETSNWRSVVPESDDSGKKSDKRTIGRLKKRKKDWENLSEKPIMGISSLIGGGIVSGNSFAGKAAIGPEYVRDNDQDVFVDPESAKARSRQLGCIGISRRISKTGRAVWIPCTNMSDYANMTGSTSLGRRNMGKKRKREIEDAVRTTLKLRTKPQSRVKRKSSLARTLLSKVVS